MSLYSSFTQLEAVPFCEKLEQFAKTYVNMGPEVQISFSHNFEKGHLYVMVRNESQLHELIAMYSRIVYQDEELKHIDGETFLKLVNMLRDDILSRQIVGFCWFNVSGSVFVTILTDDLEWIDDPLN